MLVWFLLAIPVSTVVRRANFRLVAWNGRRRRARGVEVLFIIEGIPVVLLGFAVLWMLSDTPDQARWLTDEEKRSGAQAHRQ